MPRILSCSRNSKEFLKACRYIRYAKEIAKSSPCAISKRGVIIVNADEDIVGKGYNGPNKKWNDDYTKTKCTKDNCPYIKDGRPCLGLHAEQRAILDAGKEGKGNLEETVMYHVKLDEDEQIASSRSTITEEKKACADCAPKMREVGIKEIGIVVNVDESGVIKEIHMCEIDEYYLTAFS